MDDSFTHYSIDLNEVKNSFCNLKDSIEAVKIRIIRPTAKPGKLGKRNNKDNRMRILWNNILPEFKLWPHCGRELSVYRNTPSLIRYRGLKDPPAGVLLFQSFSIHLPWS